MRYVICISFEGGPLANIRVRFFYSGLARRKSALSLIWLSIMAAAVVNFQWFFWGYSLAFSHTSGRFIGNLENFGYMNVLARPSIASASIPDIMYAVYQGMFAAITVALAVGAVAERGRILPCVIFMFIWTTLVYDPLACWTWNPSGWSNRMGGLDFAGGRCYRSLGIDHNANGLTQVHLCTLPLARRPLHTHTS
jgi:Amt family ammonium transporter